MSNANAYFFPKEQSEYLKKLKESKRRTQKNDLLPSSISLRAKMPPIYHQENRGTCVSNSVVALIEYFGDCKLRFSVQYLHEATKQFERAGVERNLEMLKKGEKVHPAFEIAYHKQILQLKMIQAANEGNENAVKPFFETFASGVRSRVMDDSGTLLRSCFRVLETRGVCRYSLWPYSPAAGTLLPEDVAQLPPGTDEDALKHRMPLGLYFLRSPKNVDEIRSILSGANSRRPMPVCITMDYFEGCDEFDFSFPKFLEDENGQVYTNNRRKGLHGVLIVGYNDDPSVAGGGYFIVRNSWGDKWSDGGYGKVPYAYVECFAVEAGSILQDMVDYLGDNYGGMTKPKSKKNFPLWLKIVIHLIIILTAVIATMAVGIIFDDPLGLRQVKQTEKK